MTNWVYINQFRRTKAGLGEAAGWTPWAAAWTSCEDLNVWDTPPNWYPSVEAGSKRWVLAVARRQAGG